jgi:rare lipoprotein A (peptidoglycan hydrolase)
MRAARNRLGRTDQPRRERANGRRSRRHARRLALLLAGAAIALSAAPAQALTGGASTLAASSAELGGGLAFGGMRSAGATWYGPGLYGRRTACGEILLPGTIGVANRRLRCGTAVKFTYRGRSLVTRVIDRGPYTVGNAWDLTNGARRALGFPGADRIRYAVALRFARR